MNWASIKRIAAKEMSLFFSSPIGYLFLAVFLVFTLFVFFWVEAFFARNIADVRPMFEWLPLLLLFLCSALTMRMWSEERRSGTLEFVSTVPVTTWSFVLGKFFACWLLLAIALLLTLPLPLTVAYLGNLDWGPVLGGYVAALLLGGAYIAIGLTISARSDNQIVSLILSTIACGVLYVIGSPLATDHVGNDVGSWLRGIGTGARFESITRGVLDFRDLYYYASLILTFLALNVFALERQRWAKDGDHQRHSAWRMGIGLVVANLLVANLWLANFTSARVDVTKGRLYSISPATANYIDQLNEPLLIRGYFSSKTHPLLAPLVPQLKDLLTEFEVAGHGKVRVEIVDPAKNPEAEDEANNKYGIRPNPFQVADRHQSSLVNSYFDVLVQYGDQFEVLGFRDLIEVKVAGESDLDVQLRNPEYDITRTIKKVLYGFQSGGELFSSIPKPLKFVGYVSNDRVLPAQLTTFKETVAKVLDGYAKESGGKLSVEFVDPEAGNGAVAKEIREKYGFRPMAASLFDTNTFYFYLTLDGGASTVVQIPLPEDLTEEGLKRSMDAAFKRFATGYLKSVALMAPEQPAYMQAMGGGGSQYSQLADTLMTDHNVERTQLTEGRVPEGAEVLVVADPQQLNDKQVFAIDQFLMQGGTVIAGGGAAGAVVHAAVADRRAAQYGARRLAFVPGHRHPRVVRDGPAELGVSDTGDAPGRRLLVPGSANARLSVFRRRARCRQERDLADHVRRAAGDHAVGVADRRRRHQEHRTQGDRPAEEFAGELAVDVDGRDAAHRFGRTLGVRTGRRSRRIDARGQRRRTVPVVLRRQGKSAARRVENGEAGR